MLQFHQCLTMVVQLEAERKAAGEAAKANSSAAKAPKVPGGDTPREWLAVNVWSYGGWSSVVLMVM